MTPVTPSFKIEGAANFLDENQKSFLDLFEEQVNKAPHAIAAIYENVELTYLELHQQSNQLAHFLVQLGVKPNTTVGISMKSNCQLLVGILGILKAGGVYLSLDPSYPPKRLQFLLDDSQPAILLTHTDFTHLFPACQCSIVAIERTWQEKCSSYSKELPPQMMIDPSQLAYLIYTSGSTGQPKGIMVPYRCFSQITSARKAYYPDHLVGLLLGSISFDVSHLTIFHLLASGGTICMPTPEALANMDLLIDLVQNQSVSFILTVPFLYSKMLEKSRAMPSLKSVSLGGENIPNHLPHLHAQFAPSALLYNEYGPSEYAIGTTIAKIYDPKTTELKPITIGKPLPNTHVYLLDDDLQPTPFGEKGEIFIGGAGLALGYLNNPKITNEKFIITDSSKQPPERLYRTGDFGRYLPSGDLEFLGRKDYQVKIRGVRIELGEIEYAIRQYDAVKESVVIVQEEKLIAFYTTTTTIMIQNDLRKHLIDCLPSYMLPSSYMQLESFPRTLIGKIDREALIVLAGQLCSSHQTNQNQPQSNMEQLILDIWRKVLNIHEIGMHDNFFDLNGTSMQIAVVQNSVQEQLNLSINLLDFYQYPSISALARHLSSLKEKNGPFSHQAQANQKNSEKRKAVFQKLRKKAIEKEMILGG